MNSNAFPCINTAYFLMQKRTREKLVNVLSLCGQEVGLTKNPSVSFILFPVYVSLVVLPVC